MNTTISHKTNSGIIEHTFNTINVVSKSQSALVLEDTLTEVHHGKSINFFLWTYVVIFSSILALVFIEEAFFIK